MAEDYVGDLKKARNELIRRRLIRYEQAIEAIEHAITEEQIAANVQPPLTRYED